MDLSFFNKVTAFILSVIVTVCGWLNVSVRPMGQKLDLSEYELVFCDDFDADELDLSAWHLRGEGKRREGYNAGSQLKLEKGELKITAEYREDGSYGTGWYSGMIALNQLYLHGYFEIKCVCNKGGGFWSAFWLQSGTSYVHDASRGGVGGAEIDIMEAPLYDEFMPTKRNSVTHAIHCNGGDDNPDKLDSYRPGKFRGNDIYNTYNTYGLEWTEDEYIFYINGVETTRTSFSKGVSTVPEEVIVSLEIPDEVTFSEGESTVMTVDYVKIYQKP